MMLIGEEMKIITVLLLLFSFGLFAEDFKRIVDEDLNYTIYIPLSWIQEKVSPVRHRFYDTTGNYRSIISIKRHSFRKEEFPNPEDWTIVNFISYELSVRYSHNPVGVIFYADSSSSLRQGELRAAEAYARFCYLEEPPLWWEEYIRFAATDTVGYEIYALGDTADMKENVAFYAAIIQSIILPKESTSVVFSLSDHQAYNPGVIGSHLRTFDLKGRVVQIKKPGQIPSGIYMRKGIDSRPETRVLLRSTQSNDLNKR